jgi:hypothetical protein
MSKRVDIFRAVICDGCFLGSYCLAFNKPNSSYLDISFFIKGREIPLGSIYFTDALIFIFDFMLKRSDEVEENTWINRVLKRYLETGEVKFLDI